ncbi:MAG: hypothetical protein GKR94_04790 [Gammaproteobacteria bacterium]|nr:hypothetical protein [Gammaproteobacteria bacterium]
MSQHGPWLCAPLEVAPEVGPGALAYTGVGAHGLGQAVAEVGLTGAPAFAGGAPDVDGRGR